MLDIALIGLNHRTADVSIRERAAFEESRLSGALRELAGRPGILEAFILSTCNRVEMLACVEDLAPGLASMESFLCDRSRLTPGELQKRLYRYTGNRAVRHLFRVTSSLDSLIIGEPQILGQVMSFYSAATKARTAGARLNLLLQAAFRVAKRVRNETDIGKYPVSAGSAAAELARGILGDLINKDILIIGAGKIGETALRHLTSIGAGTLRIANRSFESAVELAVRFRGVAVPFTDLNRCVAESDIVVASTTAQNILVDRAMAETAMRARPQRPMVFIDLSVPRNIDPTVRAITNVFCYDVDALGAVVESNLEERRKAAAIAEGIIEQEVEPVCRRLYLSTVTPTATSSPGRGQRICQG